MTKQIETMNGPFRTQTASDVKRDGLGVELLSSDTVVAEVFRCDANNSLTISTFNYDLPLTAVEQLIARARRDLGEFEDGTPLPLPNDKRA